MARSVRELIALSDDALFGECEFDTFRSSGPGGQKRNKTSSAVRLRHLPTGLIAIGVEDRSQHVNRDRALRRLRITFAMELRTPVSREAYEPSPTLARYIARNGNLTCNAKNPEFPLVAAEVLDMLVACDLRVSDAAEAIGLSTAHLVKFLESEGELWDRVNRLRREAGHKPLRKQ
jgi:hypothetical protein